MNNANLTDKSCTTQYFPAGCPTGEWMPEELHAYAQSQHQAILDDEQKLAVKYWRLGQALNFLRKNFNHGQWEQLLKGMNIDKTKASRARAIANTFAKEDEVAGLTVKQAYERRVRKKRKPSENKPDRNEEHHNLSRFLDRAIKTADGFIDYAGFAEQDEAAELLPAVDEAIAKLEQIRQLLRQQASQNAC